MTATVSYRSVTSRPGAETVTSTAAPMPGSAPRTRVACFTPGIPFGEVLEIEQVVERARVTSHGERTVAR